MSAPADQAERDRFSAEIARNFSVVASAGSGKTRAITDRIVAIARRTPALLPDLVVVTFTNRAADEMQGRARQQILEARLDPGVVAQFNRAFFGTIHSFCMKLLGEHGYQLGLPADLELVTEDDDLWREFVQRETTIGTALTPTNRELLLRHVPVARLMELGRRADLEATGPVEPGECPELDLSALLAFAADKRSAGTIGETQNVLREWDAVRRGGGVFLPMPRCSTTAKTFVGIWRESFGPLRGWLNCCSMAVATEVQRNYRAFRLEKGALTYADQIALARDLVRNPNAAGRIRARNYRVILDEAQDTDPRQFSLLLEIARPPDARGEWPADSDSPPRPGHFCMVGDFQQSIFGDRADLAHYRRTHASLVESRAADALEFSVTFRLDREGIGLINATFAEILNGADGQVDFVALSPRPDVLPGQVIRLQLEPPEFADPEQKIPSGRKAEAIARELARWIANAGLPNLRARSWRDVAILCPRKKWLRTLQEALKAAGLDVQVQSETELKGDSPAYAWLTALAHVIAQPRDHYEVVGVLREVFGVSDHDLAVFAGGRGEKFQIETAPGGSGAVERAVRTLAEVRAEALRLPLFDAIHLLIAKTSLRERLETLSDVYDDLHAELDSLIVSGARAEAHQHTFADFAESLRTNFTGTREVRGTDRDAIQLITTQKAKGSEWQAVIVPFLSRKIYNRSPSYPMLLRDPATGERLVILDAEDVTAETKAALERAERQEMERTLYVALTRAKHTLVLAHEGTAFHTAKGEAQKNSQMKWLRCASGDCNETAFENLRADATACAATQERNQLRDDRHSSAAAADPLPEMNEKVARQAREAARKFVRKVNPSGLSESVATIESDAEDLPTPAAFHAAFDNSATRYGSWWHEVMERVPWAALEALSESLLEAQISASPDAVRSRREWALLDAHLRNADTFRDLIEAKDLVAHPEMPFFWRVDAGTCVEGIIDLALFSPERKEWLIVDWKTNRVAPGAEAMKLRDRYRPQLAAYCQAVNAITDMPVEAGIYATATGEFLRYSPDELQDEWRRLRGLAAGELASEIFDDAH